MDDPQTAATASGLGAYGYVVKPFESNELLIAADNALRRRELELENRVHRQHLELLVAERTEDLMETVEQLSRAEQALRASAGRSDSAPGPRRGIPGSGHGCPPGSDEPNL